MNKVTVGILGGMGPRATLEFQSKLLAQFSGPDQSLPRIICSNNGSIPDRSDFLVNNGPDPLDVLIEEARMLTRSKVDIVCMPCNTAHSPKILSRLMAQVPLPIIDMPAACISEAEQKNFSTVLILGTTGSNRCKVFDTRTTKTNCIYPKTDDQVFIDTLIKTFKSGLQPSGVN
ncbi:aspartate/glutamate racemase family protein, partial [Candidatus Saccharibacteria bacterium]|nr:aspartate/glutamate racemase family protein [Candidatus Saccharibacteria bacterium]